MRRPVCPLDRENEEHASREKEEHASREKGREGAGVLATVRERATTRVRER